MNVVSDLELTDKELYLLEVLSELCGPENKPVRFIDVTDKVTDEWRLRGWYSGQASQAISDILPDLCDKGLILQSDETDYLFGGMVLSPLCDLLKDQGALT